MYYAMYFQETSWLPGLKIISKQIILKLILYYIHILYFNYSDYAKYVYNPLKD